MGNIPSSTSDFSLPFLVSPLIYNLLITVQLLRRLAISHATIFVIPPVKETSISSLSLLQSLFSSANFMSPTNVLH